MDGSNTDPWKVMDATVEEKENVAIAPESPSPPSNNEQSKAPRDRLARIRALRSQRIQLARVEKRLRTTKSRLRRFRPGKGWRRVQGSLRSYDYYDDDESEWECPSPPDDPEDGDYRYNGYSGSSGTSSDFTSDLETSSSDDSTANKIAEAKIFDASKADLKKYVKILLKRIEKLEGKKRRLKWRMHADRMTSSIESYKDDYDDFDLRTSKKVRYHIPNRKLWGLPKKPDMYMDRPDRLLAAHDSIAQNGTGSGSKAVTNTTTALNRVYYPIRYQKSDLEYITIPTLPSHGLDKPLHDGRPKGDEYYKDFFQKISSNLFVWVAKYFTPENISIDIFADEFPESFQGTILHTDFFKTEDFVLTDKQVKDDKQTGSRRDRRACLYRVVLFSIIAREIFAPAIVGLSGDTAVVAAKEMNLVEGNVQELPTEIAVRKRATYFTEYVRHTNPEPCIYYESLYTTCYVLSKRVFELFKPLFGYTSDPYPTPETLTSCERELFLLLSECYALQVMFQCEKDVLYKAVFPGPGGLFDATCMVDATDMYVQTAGNGKRWKRNLPQVDDRYIDCGLVMGLYRRGKVIPTRKDKQKTAPEEGAMVKAGSLVDCLVSLRKDPNAHTDAWGPCAMV